jgi:hypothetical protein
MKSANLFALHCRFLVISSLCLVITACDKFTLPRFFEDAPVQQIPAAVTLAFEQAFLDSTLTVDACGLDYDVKSGQVLSETFVDVSQQSFANVSVQRGDQGPLAAPTPVANQPSLIIHLRLVHQLYETPTRFGEEDTYKADIGFQVLAVYTDPSGNILAQRPLTYKDRVSIWAPQDTNTSATCATGQFEGAVEDAGKVLARDMLSVVPSLLGQAPPPQSTAQVPAYTPPPPPLPPISQAATVPTVPTVSFRTLLKDGNDNLILEGGETLVLQIEITNTGNTPISAAKIDMSGSEPIVQAFSRVTPLPIPIGSLQPGEKKTTEIRGRMPVISQEERGELIVSVHSADGGPAGSHKILAAIGPGTQVAPGSNPSTSQPRSRKPQQVGLDHSRYYAIIVGIDQYRDPWPQAHQIPRRHLKGLLDTLRTTGTFPKEQTRVLHGSHATRADIEEALFSWAMNQMQPDSVLLFYFAGHAVADPENGDVFLVPYEGSLKASKKRLVSLRSLQNVLGKLNIQLSLLLLDTPVIQYLNTGSMVGPNGAAPANWQGNLSTNSNQQASRVIQVKTTLDESNPDPAKLLSGLLGRADRNQDGRITVGEFLQDVQKVAEITPQSPKNFKEKNIILAQ